MLMLLAAFWWDRNSGAVGLAGLIVTTIPLAAAVVFYFLQRETKHLDWQIVTDETIVTPAAQRVTSLKVVLNDSEVLFVPRLVTVRLLNTGRREIRADDFQGSIDIKSTQLTIKTARPVRMRQGMRIEPRYDWHSQTCYLEGTLYNRGDWLEVQLLLDMHESASTYGDVAKAKSALEDDAKLVGPGPVFVECIIAGQTRRSKQVTAELRQWRGTS